MIVSIAASIIIGSLLWMDREYAFQVQVSRPLVISTVLGFVTGNLEAAMLVGMALEIIGLNTPPVGTYLPYDESFCTIVAVPVASVSSGIIGYLPAAGFSLILCMPTLIIGREMDALLLRRNEKHVENLDNNWLEKIDGIMLKVLTKMYLKVLAVNAACVTLFCAIAYYMAPVLSETVLKVLAYMPLAAVIIGISGLFIGKRMRSRYSWIGAFILGIASGLIWIGL